MDYSWVSIRDAIPDAGERVLFYSPEWDEIMVGCVRGERWFDEDSGEANGVEREGVTHWHSLPKKPFEP